MHEFPNRIIFTVTCCVQCRNYMLTARLLHGLVELFGLHVVMNINEKKYALLLAQSLRRRTTSYDMIHRAALKSTDDVVLIKTVLISA
jgi:hypothetical protein